jgi:pimeloyl-ACP methyl ester carboxylesterase
MEAIAIPSHGARMNGLIYLAAGAGPHPIVVFLHGFPGNERNLDLAQAVRSAGYHAFYFDYRGAWGAAGTFTFAHGLEDLAAVFAWLREPQNAAKYHFDPQQIALVGHSYGGWLALMCAGHEPANVGVVALAAWNLGWAGNRFAEHADERKDNIDDFRQSTDPAGGPIRGDSDDLINEMSEHAAAWDYIKQGSNLKDHPLLLVAASRDTPDEGVDQHARLAQAIEAAGGKQVTVRTFEDDHPFSAHRVALADVLIKWLREDCFKR